MPLHGSRSPILLLALWLAATGATLVLSDRALIASGPWPPNGFTPALALLARAFDPAIILPGLAVIAVVATIGRTSLFGPRIKARAVPLQHAAWALLRSGLVATIAALGLKAVIGRARPHGEASMWLTFEPFNILEGFQSMPSAHAALAGSLAATAACLWKRRLLTWLCSGALMGAIRVLGGEHWPSDVVAGLGLGALLGMLTSPRGDAPASAAASSPARRQGGTMPEPLPTPAAPGSSGVDATTRPRSNRDRHDQRPSTATRSS